MPLGLSQDDVQDISVGKGNVVREAANTGEDLGFCRDGCEPETVSSSSGLAKKDGAFSLPRWKSCSLEEGDERNVIPLPACLGYCKVVEAKLP